MIFITVGTQLPFDRLMNLFTEWQEYSGYAGDVVAQVGEGSHFTSSRIKVIDSLSSDQYYHWFSRADGVVSHAGMGSILSCLDYSKRGVFLPRKYALGEHRNDHQLDTVNAFERQYETLYFCTDKESFFNAMNVLVENIGIEVQPMVPKNESKLGKNIAAYLGLGGRLP